MEWGHSGHVTVVAHKVVDFKGFSQNCRCYGLMYSAILRGPLPARGPKHGFSMALLARALLWRTTQCHIRIADRFTVMGSQEAALS